KDRTGNSVVLAISMEDKRPDFTLVSLGHRLYLVEIKRPKYAFADSDAERLVNYIDVFDEFFLEHRSVRDEFTQRYQIILIVDSIGLKQPAFKQSVKAALDSEKLAHVKWKDFLSRAKKAHQQFLEASDKASDKAKKAK